jgi:aminoglycoside 2'-N-acetyltransferase I
MAIAVVVAQTSQLGVAALTEIRALLDVAFEGEFSDEDWAHTVGGTHVLARDDGLLVAHAALVERVLEVDGRPFRTGYVEGAATHPGREGEGLGSLVMAELDGCLRAGFELGALSTGRHSFYGRLGWERWAGPTSARHGAVVVRTEDDDDGLMVLRFGPSAGIDLGAPISCEARVGDDW